MKKKVLSLLLIGILVIVLTGCGSKADSKESNSSSNSNNNSNDSVVENKAYENGTVVYFNPETNEACEESAAVSKTGTKTGCMKWYIFLDDKEEETVNLLLDHNTTALVKWSSNGKNNNPDVIKEALQKDITSWNDTIKQSARLLTAGEVAQITENSSFDETVATISNRFYLDTNSEDSVSLTQGQSKYSWLYDYTYACTYHGCNIMDSEEYAYNLNKSSKSTIWGYWTSTPISDSTQDVWVIQYEGMLTFTTSVNDHTFGLRPVITIDKSLIA